MSAPLGIGILGVARITGEAVVLPARSLGHRLVSVASRDPRRAEFFAGLCSVERVAASYEEVLRDPAVDLVYIPQIPAEHARWTLAAIAAGKHVLCEKPLCTDAREADAVRAAARRRGVIVQEGLHHLCHPLWDRIAALVADDGPLGAVRGVRVELSMRPPDAADPRRSPAAGGGVLLDLGYYGLRILLLLARSAGGPPRITDAVLRHGAGPAGSGAPGADIEARVRAVYPSGARGRVDASMDAAGTVHRLTVTGTRARMVVDGFLLPHLGGSLTLQPLGAQAQGQAEQRDQDLFAGPSTYTHQLRMLAGRIREGRPMPPGASLDDAVATMRLLDSARESAVVTGPPETN